MAAGVRLVTSSSRVLVDEALPDDELERVREVMRSHQGTEVLGFHALRARRGVKRCRSVRPSPPRICPSIQPWQSASSTAWS